MTPWAVLGIAIGLGADAMSVSAAVGVRWHEPRQKFRLAWHMGLFQFLMPVIGSLAGLRLAALLQSVGKYLAAVLIVAVGVKMLVEAWRDRPGQAVESTEEAPDGPGRKDPTRGWSLVVLSIATSLDALVVGFSLGVTGKDVTLLTDVLIPALVIGIVAAMMSLVGVVIGQRAGSVIGRPAEFIGAGVLIVLGILLAM